MKSKPEMTLDRLLSRFGVASRTVAREAIQAGRVRVNGRIQRDPACWVRPRHDHVQLDGERLRPERKVYLAFYKPKGVIVTRADPDGRKTVYDYLEDYLRGLSKNRGGSEGGTKAKGSWLAPVGRLDKDTSGLLLATNDTEFAHFVTSPESCVPKTYRVKLNGLMDEETLSSLRSGVRMKRGDAARPLSVRRLEDRGKYTWLEIVLTEGKNREVRRMVEAVGFKVLKLVRTSIGPLTLSGLEVGRVRPLSAAEVAAVRSIRPHLPLGGPH
ncbi:MAG TPA: pseudouridine synthase [Terriglobia bacterium]|nr:pseudouridine synthase [Terriglobia bacterium]